MLELERHLTGEVVAETDTALQVQSGTLKGGMGAHMHVRAVGLSNCGHVADALSIQHHVSQGQLSVDKGSLRSPGAGCMKIGPALHGDPRGFKSAKTGQLNIHASQVEA